MYKSLLLTLILTPSLVSGIDPKPHFNVGNPDSLKKITLLNNLLIKKPKPAKSSLTPSQRLPETCDPRKTPKTFSITKKQPPVTLQLILPIIRNHKDYPFFVLAAKSGYDLNKLMKEHVDKKWRKLLPK